MKISNNAVKPYDSKPVYDSQCDPAQTKPVRTSGQSPRVNVDVCEVKPSALPPAVSKAKAQILKTARANTNNVEGIEETRKKLAPNIRIMSDYFKSIKDSGAVTGDQEKELTAGNWRSRWFDDKEVGDVGPLKLNRERVWQIVNPIETGEKESYYYNAFEYKAKAGGFEFGKARGFLRGKYSFSESNPPKTGSATNIDLEFTYNGIRPFGFKAGSNIEKLVDKVENSNFASVPVPGPIGIKGKLRNLYIDKDIRISEGIQLDKSDPSRRDLYILERGATV